MKILATNRKARRDYEILETIEAGISLKGYEVKSVKDGRMSLKASFVTFRGEEAYLLNASIPSWQPANTPKDYDATRSRRLLLKKSEIASLIGSSKTKGLTIIPLKVYNKRGWIKVLLGVVRGRSKTDKREVLKKRAIQREIERAFVKKE